MHKQLLTTVLLLVTYWVNYLSSSGQLGETMMKLREVFPFPYMPEGWTFGVARTAIYLMLGVWVIWSWTDKWKKSEINNQILPRFWLSSVLNIIRIYFTARERYVLSVIVIALLMKVLWNILAITSEFRKKQEFHWGAIVTRNAFWLYAWRVTMATTIVGISQLVYLTINNQRPLTMRWTIGIIALWTGTALRLYKTYRNPSQFLISIVALIGVIMSVVG
jgi:hypothetical protein